MELSRPRSCGVQGAKPTHDFLPLYSSEQDPTPTIPGDYLKTRDFLHPLEQVEKHILPGGFGTYSINHISYINQTQKVPKPEGVVITAAQSSSSDKNNECSNCSSYTWSGFALGEERNLKKGKKGKADTSNPDQKPNSPRSKHSATEQRRRSKINDRFLMLRELIPHGDRKRDKASFLLEVVEYIQFLQEKVHKYEDSCGGWNNQPPKIIPLNDRPAEDFIDQSQLPNGLSVPTFVFSSKSNENNTNFAPTVPTNNPNILDSNTSSRDAIKLTGQHPQFTHKLSPSVAVSQLQPHLRHSRSCTADCTVASDKLKDKELIIERGTISISTVYSQRISSALTQALQNSGVDLTHANISVQIDLGKGSNTNTLDSSTPFLKKNETPIDQTLTRSRTASTWEENGEAFKRLKRSRN